MTLLILYCFTITGGLHFPTINGRERRTVQSMVMCASMAACFLHESSEDISAAAATQPKLLPVRQDPLWLPLPPPETLQALLEVMPLSQTLHEIEELYLYFLSPECQLKDVFYSAVVEEKSSDQARKRPRKQLFTVQGPGVLSRNTLKNPVPNLYHFPQLLTKFGDSTTSTPRLLSSSTKSLLREQVEPKRKTHTNREKVLHNNDIATPTLATDLLNELVQMQIPYVKKVSAADGKRKHSSVQQCLQEGTTPMEIKNEGEQVSTEQQSTYNDTKEASSDECKVGTSSQTSAVAEESMSISSSRSSAVLLPGNGGGEKGDDVSEVDVDTSAKSKKKERSKSAKKRTINVYDFYRTRWDIFEKRHVLSDDQRSMCTASDSGPGSTCELLSCRRMPTTLVHGKTGWVVVSKTDGDNDGAVERDNSEVKSVASPVVMDSGLIDGSRRSPLSIVGVPQRGSVSLAVASSPHGLQSSHSGGMTREESDFDPSELHWEPIECCTFCHGSEEEALLGRLLPFTGSGGGSVPGGLWAHVNCVRSAALCHEWPSGAVTGAEKAQERAQETLCTLCGEVGAAVKCEKATCKDYFHLKCAIACDFSFSESKKTKLGVLSKLAVRSSPIGRGGTETETNCHQFSLLSPPTTATTDRKYFTLSACCEVHRLESKKISAPPDLSVLRNPLHKVQVVEDSYMEDAEAQGYLSAPTASKGYNRLHSSTGMQYRQNNLHNRNTANNKAKSAVETYWDYRQNVIEEKISLLKAGGHGLRLGALTVHRLGAISFELPGHHSADYIFPRGFKSSRIFWSRRFPMTRTLYTFEIQSAEFDMHNQHQRLLFPRPQFIVAISDEPGVLIVANSIEQCFVQIVEKVKEINKVPWPGMFASLLTGAGGFKVSRGGVQPNPTITPSASCTSPTFAFNSSLLLARAALFFGIGQELVRFAIESQPEALAMMVPQLFFAEYPMSDQFPVYRPRFHLPSKAQLAEVLRRRAQQQQICRKNLHGSSRAEGWVRDKRSINMALAGAGDTDGKDKDRPNSKKGTSNKSHKGGASKVRRGENLTEEGFEGEWNDDADELEGARRKARLLRKYQELSERYQADPFEKLVVKRSHIHGYGLYARIEIAKDEMIIEYIGEQVRQVVADTREEAYEELGLGSCYMFRLDKEYIVDATHTGSMARFINHCCEANAYARVINVEPIEGDETFSSGHQGRGGGPKPVEKRIVIFAGRTIQPGEEVTYDYKFPIEDEKLKCYCGAAKCRGSMN